MIFQESQMRRIAVRSGRLESMWPKTLENVLSVYTHKLEGQSIKVEKIWEAETEIQALAGGIRRVFCYLIANRIASMPRGGRPTLKGCESHDWGEATRAGGPGGGA